MSQEEVFFAPADNDRIQGKQQLHERLKVQEDGLPLIMVYDTCTHFLRTVPSLKLDDNNMEDIDTDMEDHVYDETRYFLMSRPIIPHRLQKKRSRYDKKPNMNTTWMSR